MQVYAPFSIALPLPGGFNSSSILALGGELKSSICLIHNGHIYLSEAIGDLEQEHVLRHFYSIIDAVIQRPDLHLDAIAIDLHPDYLSSQYGERLAAELKIPLIRVQHHHAHIAALMVESGIAADAEPLLGIALDGLGYGSDHSLWGGELLHANYRSADRLGRLTPVAMPGGSAAASEPWRNTLAHLLPFWGEAEPLLKGSAIGNLLSNKPLPLLQQLCSNARTSPPASSCGRLFDAVAAALNLHAEKIAFEAEAAIALEQLATPHFDAATAYPVAINNVIDNGNGLLGDNELLEISWQPMWLALLNDLSSGVEHGIIAARFHCCLCTAVAETAAKLCAANNINQAALSGGVLQNRLIAGGLSAALQQHGIRVLQHRQLPAHDGAIAVGQAIIAATQLSLDVSGQSAKN